MDKRYQVFISSTYADLKDERQSVMRAVMDLNCIPSGMEFFPATDEEQFSYIKRIIDDCDYYVIIVGGRYGSVAEDGISFTEKEYDYAVGRRIPVLAFIHEDPESITFGKSEKDPDLRKKLEAFKENLCKGRLVKFWRSAEQLPAQVMSSLGRTMQERPAVGWVRGNKPANEQVLAEIHELRNENSRLSQRLAEVETGLQPSIPDLARLDEQVELHGRYQSDIYAPWRPWSSRFEWKQLFGYVAPYLAQLPADSRVKDILEKAVFKKSGFDSMQSRSLDDQDFRTFALQLQALGLVDIQYAEAAGGGYGYFWHLTTLGEKWLYELRTIRSAVNTADAGS